MEGRRRWGWQVHTPVDGHSASGESSQPGWRGTACGTRLLFLGPSGSC